MGKVLNWSKRQVISYSLGLAIFVVIGLGIYAAETISNPMPEFDPSRVELLVVQYTNEERTKHGLRPLANDEKLASIARHHSVDMGNRDYYDHVTPEGLDTLDRIGYHCQMNNAMGVAENIALVGLHVQMGTGSWHSEESLAKDLVDSWMESPGHRENILEKNFYRIGVGVSITGINGVYATQDFC